MKNNQVIWLLIFICAGIFLVWRMSNSEAGRIWHYPVAHEFADTGTKVNWEPIKRIDDDGRHGEKQGPAVTEYVISRRADATADWTEVETADVHLKDGHLVYPSQLIDKDGGPRTRGSEPSGSATSSDPPTAEEASVDGTTSEEDSGSAGSSSSSSSS